MDYNIYIHDKTSNQGKPTQPRKGGGTNTAPKQNTSQKESSGGSGFSLAAIKEGWSNMSGWGKAAIVMFVIKKATEICIRTVDTIEPFVTRETGDYRFNIVYGNVKQVLNNIKNPVGTVLSAQTYYQENKLFAQKQEQERLLIGDSIVNQRTRNY